MKTVIALFLGASLSTSVFAAAPSIPKQFYGTWGENTKSCKIPKDSPIDFPDTGAKIGSKGIERYENYCELKSLSKSSANLMKGKFACAVEGEESEETITLNLQANAKLSGLNEKTLVRCK